MKTPSLLVSSSFAFLCGACASTTTPCTPPTLVAVETGADAVHGIVRVRVDTATTDAAGRRRIESWLVAQRLESEATGSERASRLAGDLRAALGVGDEAIESASGLDVRQRDTSVELHAQRGVAERVVVEFSEGRGAAPAVSIAAGRALVAIEAVGDVTGTGPHGASRFRVDTERGTISVPLQGDLRRVDVLLAVQEELERQGVATWLEWDEAPTLLALLDAGGVRSLGAATDDGALIARVTLLPGVAPAAPPTGARKLETLASFALGREVVDASAELRVRASAGEAQLALDYPLHAGASLPGILLDVRTFLAEHGATTFFDPTQPALYILLETGGVNSIAAGATDSELMTTVGVYAP